MKRILLVLALLFFTVNAGAVEVAGIKIADSAEVAGEKLQLNGYGIRKKYAFVKVYVGSLYTAQKATSPQAVTNQPGSKLIGMDFLYKKVEKKKIIDAFAEGFAKNSPKLVATPQVRQFLALFKDDFVAGDRVELSLSAGGTVSASHNDKQLGSIDSPELAKGVLLIYLGEQPADEDMKEGMLGRD